MQSSIALYQTPQLFCLQANDFEAYQELLREQGAKETQGERYEVITKFLNDTEDYLHKLAGKVSNVKLQQEASEAFTKATVEARAMVSSMIDREKVMRREPNSPNLNT